MLWNLLLPNVLIPNGCFDYIIMKKSVCFYICPWMGSGVGSIHDVSGLKCCCFALGIAEIAVPQCLFRSSLFANVVQNVSFDL